jgi:hypothetical protein
MGIVGFFDGVFGRFFVVLFGVISCFIAGRFDAFCLELLTPPRFQESIFNWGFDGLSVCTKKNFNVSRKLSKFSFF